MQVGEAMGRVAIATDRSVNGGGVLDLPAKSAAVIQTR